MTKIFKAIIESKYNEPRRNTVKIKINRAIGLSLIRNAILYIVKGWQTLVYI